MRKIWLLDFDGVVNAVSAKPPPTWDDWKSARINGFNILWSQSVIDCIRFAHEYGVDVQWLSTWCENTKDFQAHISGLPELPWLDTTEVDKDDFRRHWKLTAAQEFVPADANLMWTEDEKYLTKYEAEEWLSARKGPSQVINPNTNLGLTRKQVEQIYEWVKE